MSIALNTRIELSDVVELLTVVPRLFGFVGQLIFSTQTAVGGGFALGTTGAIALVLIRGVLGVVSSVSAGAL